MNDATKITMGAICFDRQAKELVKITNGIGADASATGEFIPTEAIALRVVGYRELKRGPRPSLAWTYRKVEAKDLEAAPDGRAAFEGALACIKVRV